MKKKLAYGKLGYRTDQWFNKKMKQSRSLKSTLEKDKSMLNLLSYVAKKVIKRDYVPYDPKVHTFNVSLRNVNIISLSDCDVDFISILRTSKNNKRYLLHRNYTTVNESVSSYSLFDEYDIFSDCLALYGDEEVILEEINKQVEKLQYRIYTTNAELRQVNSEIMEELAQKREVIDESVDAYESFT